MGRYLIFYKLKNVSQELPATWCSGKRYLTRTVEESYTMYKDDCEKQLKKPVYFSTFASLWPKDLYKIGEMPDWQCICDQCEKFCLDRQAFIQNKIKGILNHTDECIK